MTVNEEYEHRHPSTQHMMIMLRPNINLKGNYFRIAESCAYLAEDMTNTFPDSPELTAGLRKLLEAKDCFVRCAVYNDEESDMNKPVDYRDH